MNAETIFAVVDLETTGTSVKDGDRMIQFGCALMQHGKIIQTISQLVNPDRSVPVAIQRLTGLDPNRLVAAPYFEEIAKTVKYKKWYFGSLHTDRNYSSRNICVFEALLPLDKDK